MSSLTREDITDRVCTLAADQAGMKRAEVVPRSHFIQDLNFDSLDKVEFVMVLEDEFEVSIPDEVADKALTVGDAIDIVVAFTTRSPSPG